MVTYLDYNASAPIDLRVLQLMNDIYTNHYGNADSQTHSFGMNAKIIVEDARKTIGDLLGVEQSDVIFTSGSTESNNMATLGLLQYALESGKTHFITTSIEHKSILETMKYLETKGCQVDYVSPDETGRIRPEQVLDLVTDKTLLVSVMHVNSETGVIQPVKAIGDALEKSGVFFHIDATQSFGKLNESIRSTKFDMLSCTAHKLRGPQGIGAFILRRGVNYKRPPFKPLMFGGHQERGFRPGTIPVALVAGFAKAAQLCESESKQNWNMCMKIKEDFFKAIAHIEYDVNGDQNYCLPSTVNISFKGVDSEGIFVATRENYAFSNGSACNSDSHKPSYVLQAMGLPEKRIDEAIRISWCATTKVDFSELVDYIKSIV